MSVSQPTQLQLREVDWIEQHLKIRGVPFILDDYQKEILLEDNLFKLINKSRKTGITTLIAADALYKCITYSKFTGIIASKDDRASKYVLSFVSDFLSGFPIELVKLIVTEESKTEITFITGSRLICVPCNPNAIRGFDADEIWVDEFAFFNESERDNDVRFMAAAIPALSVRRGGITFISTPNGKKGVFFQLVNEAIEQMSRGEIPTFSLIVIHWSKCKRLYSMIGKIKLSMPQPKELWFRQEYENSFEANIQGFIEKELLMLSVDDKLVLEVS